MTVAPAPVTVGSSAPAPKLVRPNGKPAQLASLWKKQPLVLDFLAPIAGPYGEDDAVRLRDGRELFDQAGGRLAAVCRAPLAEAVAFDGRWHLGYDFLCDEDGSAFEAYGVTEEAPGSFVIDTKGKVCFVHRNGDQDDSVSMWDLIDAVSALTGKTLERPKMTPIDPELEELVGSAPASGMFNFVCGKCGNTSYEVETLSPSGGSMRLFSSQNRKFSAVSCTNCRHTELYKAEGIALARAFDIQATS
jgi:predicted nucleic-acid-binding Zn-ribbon protein/peroxiredoxin